jgi:hypothetical protein
MSRRRRQSTPIDFFAFQDIVTATTGILIVVALLLALSIGSKRISDVFEARKAAEQSQSAIEQQNKKYQLLKSELESREALTQKIADIKAAIAGYLQAEIDRLETSHSGPAANKQYRRVIPPTQSGLRRPALVVAQNNGLILLDSNGNQTEVLDLTWGSTLLQNRLKALIGKSASSILILIKPSAFKHYGRLQSLGLDSGKILFPYGYDIVPEDWEFQLQ